MALRSGHFVPEHVPLYDYLDDLEAFFWVFAYLVLTRKPNGDRMPQDPFLESTVEGWLQPPLSTYHSKRDFLDSPTIEDELREAIDPDWDVIFDDLFLGFHAFTLEISNQKSKLVYKGRTKLPNGTLAPNRFDPILVKIDDHYARVLALFDTALEKIKRLDLETIPSSLSPPQQPASVSASFSTNSAGTTSDDSASVGTSATSAEETFLEPSNGADSRVDAKVASTLIPPNSSPQSASLMQSISRSKRRSDEAELDDESLKESKRRCPPSRRQFQGMLGSVYQFCWTLFE